MKKLLLIFFCLCSPFLYVKSSSPNSFKLYGAQTDEIILNMNWSESTEISPFSQNLRINGLSINGYCEFKNAGGVLRIILIDSDENEYLVYEAYQSLKGKGKILLNDVCQETSLLNSILSSKTR